MSTDMNQWQSICKLDEIPAQGARVVKREGKTDIALFRTLDNRVFALDDHCPHKGGALSHGLVYGDTVACPLHNFKISLQTGQAQAPDEGHTPCHKVELRDDVGLAGRRLKGENEMGYRLFIDPATTPQAVYPDVATDWQTAGNHDQAVMAVVLNGLPDEVCASKTWSESDDGQQFARWLVSADLDGTIRLNEHFVWRSHDAGGAEVVEGRSALSDYLNSKFFKCRLNVLPR